MRCLCCNEILNDFESTRKSAYNKQFLDMCNKCYGEVENDIPSDVRLDLMHQSDTFMPDDYDNEDMNQ